MAQLTWENWYRSDGCRKWMDKTTFAGTSFTDIFWRGMRLVFMDEGGRKGLLYTGGIGVYAQKIIKDANRPRVGYSVEDEKRMLWDGDFKYNDHEYKPNGSDLRIRLRFEGPDKADLNAPIYYSADDNGYRICVQFYNLVKDAKQGTGSFEKFVGNGKWVPNPLPENEAGIYQLAYFTGAYVLAGIMENHNFLLPAPDTGKNPTYSLPRVAIRSTLMYAKEKLKLDGIDNNTLPTF